MIVKYFLNILCFVLINIYTHYFLFLKNINFPYYQIEKLNKNLYILGDSLYMIGGSVTGAGVYEIVVNNKILTTVLILGTILIFFGASIRSKYKKGE